MTSLNQSNRLYLGEGLFETIRIHHGQPCYCALHFERLVQSCANLQMPMPLTHDAWQALLSHTVSEHQMEYGAIKVILFGDQAPRGLVQKSQRTQVEVEVFNVVPGPIQPVRLQSCPWRRDAKNPIYQIKSINYLESVMAKRHAASLGFDDVLFLNTDDKLLETTIANLFVLIGNELITPPITDGILPGITRARILMLAPKVGFKVKEASLTFNSLAQCDGAFVSNSLKPVTPVSGIDDVVLPNPSSRWRALESLIEDDTSAWLLSIDK